MSPAQLALDYVAGDGHRPHWQHLRRLLREVVDFVGCKEVAYDLDVSPSALLHALDERERHHVRAEWIPYLIRRAPNDSVLEFLASLRGLELVPRKELTPEEELARLKEELAKSLGPELVRGIYTRAFSTTKR
jgi:hypothetical protein